MSELRQRKVAVQTEDISAVQAPLVSEHSSDIQKKNDQAPQLLPGSYWLTRILFLRYLAFIYAVAFAIALHQNTQLIGRRGLTPLHSYLNHISRPGDSVWDRLTRVPTLFWFTEPEQVDGWLNAVALFGLLLAGLVLVAGAANMLVLLLLLLLYTSLVYVGQVWYSFGWESQLLETGFLAVFLVPASLSVTQLPAQLPAPWVGVWGYRWLIVRIMLGAGLIKVRGDACWLDLTCMNYFYETQPNPNPVAYYAHSAPGGWHAFETLGNHVVELVLPLLTLLPWRLPGMLNGLGQIFFQATV